MQERGLAQQSECVCQAAQVKHSTKESARGEAVADTLRQGYRGIGRALILDTATINWKRGGVTQTALWRVYLRQGHCKGAGEWQPHIACVVCLQLQIACVDQQATPLDKAGACSVLIHAFLHAPRPHCQKASLDAARHKARWTKTTDRNMTKLTARCPMCLLDKGQTDAQTEILYNDSLNMCASKH